jgi:hypothetical protein
MALSKANLLQVFFITVKNIVILPILAGSALYNSTIKVLNLNTSVAVQLYQEYFNLDFITITALYIIMFGMLLSMKNSWVKVALTGLVAFIWLALFIDAANIIFIMTKKSITIPLIEAFLPPMLLALLCLYSIDILIFMVNFLRRRIHQPHTPR